MENEWKMNGKSMENQWKINGKSMEIVLRQPAVQSVQLARTSAIVLCGKIICIEIKMQKKNKFSEAGENNEQQAREI